MASVLLGVSGGIAAYKALETARLAVKAGHALRVIQTAASERFVGRASFEAITGAPVLVDEFEADPLRGAFPGEPAQLLEACDSLLSGAPTRSWAGVRVLVTAGGTREPIDSVRYIGNRSSGRMGVALATRALARGAEVTLVAANLSVPAPAGVRVVEVHTAAELAAVTGKEFSAADVLRMAAAVADYRPS